MVFGARKSQNNEKNLAKVHRIGEIFLVINIRPSIMDTFGELKAKLQKNGETIDDFDLQIGSTALVNNMILVTNNEKHFSRIDGLEIENWSKE
jgi:tRNA(fMet)-specific endonuclease VapC